MLTLWTDFSQMAGNIGLILVVLGFFASILIVYKVISFMYLGVMPTPMTKHKSIEIFTAISAIKDKEIKIVHSEYYISQLQSGFNIFKYTRYYCPPAWIARHCNRHD